MSKIMMGSKFLKLIEGCFCYYYKKLYFLLIKKGKTEKSTLFIKVKKNNFKKPKRTSACRTQERRKC